MWDLCPCRDSLLKVQSRRASSTHKPAETDTISTCKKSRGSGRQRPPWLYSRCSSGQLSGQNTKDNSFLEGIDPCDKCAESGGLMRPVLIPFQAWKRNMAPRKVALTQPSYSFDDWRVNPSKNKHRRWGISQGNLGLRVPRSWAPKDVSKMCSHEYGGWGGGICCFCMYLPVAGKPKVAILGSPKKHTHTHVLKQANTGPLGCLNQRGSNQSAAFQLVVWGGPASECTRPQ